MKISVSKISPEGLDLEELIPSGELDIEAEGIKIPGHVKVRAYVTRITNAVSVDLSIELKMQLSCSRCLEEFISDYRKKTMLNYQVERPDQVIDLNPDIREEIMLDYAVKNLCKPDCRGLCLKCGMNLNEKECNCKKQF